MASDRFATIYAFLSRPAVQMVLIAVIGILLYSNTLHSPFQWDELKFIETNPIIKDLGYFLDPSRAEGLELYATIRHRYVGFLTFALNYKINGLEVTGYHLVNISIHIINSLLVYLLVILTFKTPFFEAYRSPLFARGKSESALTMNNMVAFFTALVFVSHPLQTEAVTYIFQRLASLVTMFYLISLIMYINFRLKDQAKVKVEIKTEPEDRANNKFLPLIFTFASTYAYYLLSVLFAVMAMKTKENAFTLPLMIATYELSFFNGRMGKRTLRLIPILLTLLIIPLTLTGIDKPAGEIIGSMADVTRGDASISRMDYLFTQFRVIVTYIRLLFLPTDQNIDYDYPVFHSFFDKPVLMSFLFLICILCLGIYLFYRSRATNGGQGSAGRASRLIAFGIFWFFITLSVESSVIPIPMTINEYRVLLPSVGAFLGIITAVFLLFEKIQSSRVRVLAVSSSLLVILIFSYAAYARNGVWEDEISLWEDVVKKSPQNPRGHNNLGYVFYKKGLTDKAITQYNIALQLKPDYADAHNNLGIAYKTNGLIDKAIEEYMTVLSLDPASVYARSNLGNAYRVKGSPDKALEQYEAALRLNPDFAEAHFNKGIIYLEKGLIEEARIELETALRINPDYKKARHLLSTIIFR